MDPCTFVEYSFIFGRPGIPKGFLFNSSRHIRGIVRCIPKKGGIGLLRIRFLFPLSPVPRPFLARPARPSSPAVCAN